MNFEYMNAIMKFLNHELKDIPNENWVMFSNDLKKLVDEISLYNGDNNIANKEALDKINNLFNTAIKSADKYLKTPFNDNDPSEAIRHNMTKKLNDEFLAKLYVDFSNIDSSKNIKESLDKFRSLPIKVTEDEIKQVGGNLSSRTKLSLDIDGQKVSGVFTPTTIFDSKKGFKNILDEIIKKYPRYEDYFSKLNTTSGLSRYAGIGIQEVISNTGFINIDSLKTLGDIGYIPNELRNTFNKFKEEDDFLAANLELINKVGRFDIGRSINTSVLELKPSDKIDNRNSAMSGIAHLLDSDNVVAKSRPITIERVIDGKTVFIEGTFMEEAKGKDLSNLAIDDEVYEMNAKNLDSGLGKKALANLQVIDYICGNVDRHAGNIFYQFDPNTKKLIGVMGIDNDASFFKRNPKMGDYKHLFVTIPKMVVIDSEMAFKVRKLEEAPFKATLMGYGLDNEEIEAAWERTKKLQAAIDNAVMYEKGNAVIPDEEGITIIPSGDWDDVKFDDIAHSHGNIFKRARAQFSNLSGKMVPDNEKILDTSIKLFAYKSKLGYVDNYLSIARRNANFFGTSTRFKNIIKALEEANNEKNLEKRFKKLDKLEKAIDVYKLEKVRDGVLDKEGNIIQEVTGKALNRINLVNELDGYVKIAKILRKDYIESDDKRIKDAKEAEEFNAIHRKGNYQFYPKAIKDENGKIIIDSNIYNRDEDFIKSMKPLNEEYEAKAMEGFRKNDEKLADEANNIDKAMNNVINNLKETLTEEYHNFMIPKEYYDARMNQLNNRLFDQDINKSFVSNKPEKKDIDIFQNNLNEELNEDIKAHEDNNEIIIDDEVVNNIEK